MFSLLSVIDDIASTLDDVAAMSKVAIKNTSALMTDDLAVNAGVVVGVKPHREIPMVLSIFWGSILNKVYCISGILILSALYKPLVTGIMLIGGLYLSYEAVHKIIEKLSSHKKGPYQKKGLQVTEKEKIAGAVRTDLILSAEIIVIAQSEITGNLFTQVLTLSLVGLAASLIIYGLVAVIVKVDDFGLHLIESGYKKIGLGLVQSMPYVMKMLGIVGTLAMLLVGGGIITHIFHIPLFLPPLVTNMISGLAVGTLTWALFSLAKSFK